MAALFILGVTVPFLGKQAFLHWAGPAASLSNELYIPSAMFAAGRGLHNAPVEPGSAFFNFLQFGQQYIDETEVQNLPIQPLDPHQAYHRYLLWTVGAWWQLRGISWDAFKELSIFFLVLTAWLIYGCMVFFVPWWLAVPLTICAVTAPAMLFTVQYLRDFAKAPFFLGVLLSALIFIRNGRKGNHALTFGVVSGLITGIGMGFRRDFIIVPPVLAGLLILVPMPGESARLRRWGYRVVGGTLMVSTLLFSGWPIWQALYTFGSLTDHDTLMGFATNGDVEMGVYPASYEKIPLLNDLYVSACATAYEQFGMGQASAALPLVIPPYPGANAKSQLIRHFIQDFPWDTLVVRWAAAAITLTKGIQPHQAVLLAHLETVGEMMAALAVCVLLFRYGFRGLLMVLLLFVFPGYTSLQFSMRHGFHFSFLPWLSAGLIVISVIRGLQFLIRFGRSGKILKYGNICTPNRKQLLLMVCGILVFCGIAGGLKLYQQKKQLENAHRLRSAISNPIPFMKDRWDEWVLFIPQPARPENPEQIQAFNKLAPDMMMADYCVAAFDKGTPPWAIQLVYEDTRGWDGFSVPIRLYLPDWEHTKWFLCFPVFQVRQGHHLIRFAGLGVDSAVETKFLGFFDVEPPMLPREAATMVIGLPESNTYRNFAAAQRIDLGIKGQENPPGWRVHHPRMDVHAALERTAEMIENSNHADAREIVSDWLDKRPSSLAWTLMAAKLALRESQPNAARSILDHYLARYGKNFLGEALDGYLRNWLSEQKRKNDTQAAHSISESGSPESVPSPGGKNNDHTAKSLLNVGILSGSMR